MRIAGLMFCLLAAASVLAAQGSGQEQPEGAIHLDVVVTDASARPVSGLAASNFKLLGDRKELAIRSFAAYDNSHTKADPPARMILIIDCVNNNTTEIGYIRQGLLNFLTQNNGRLAQPTSIARFTLSGAEMLSEPSTDGNALAKVVEQISAAPRTEEVDSYSLSIKALSTFVNDTANEPGRKMLIWLGRGWPVAVPGVHMLTDIDKRGRLADFQLMVQFARAMQAGRIALYGGYKRPDFYIRNYSKPVRKVSEANPRQLALEVLAARSGGHGESPAITSESVVTDVLNDLVAEAGTFYSLSFDPQSARSADELHQLDVVLDKPGLTVHTITGYFYQPEYFRIQLKKRKAVAPKPVVEAAVERTPVTAAQLIEVVQNSKGMPDSDLAKKLEGLYLTQRLSRTKSTMLNAELPGGKSKTAFTAVADASTFLPPPKDDVIARTPPDVNEQRRMMALTVDYLRKTLPRLPDFYATRTTIRYGGDAPEIRQHKRSAAKGDLFWRKVGSAKAVVTYRDGKEVVNPREWRKHSSHPEEGMIARGTFGPILLTVIVDAAHGKTTWDRWEQGSGGMLAVFRYLVPQDQSHYSLGLGSLTGQVVGYHGEVAIDPATGTILRLTVQADPPLGSPILQGDIMVQYDAVEIGGKTYTCPIRSVSMSLTMEGLGAGLDLFVRLAQPPQAMLLNDVTFEDYHLFRSHSRILTGDMRIPKH